MRGTECKHGPCPQQMISQNHTNIKLWQVFELGKSQKWHLDWNLKDIQESSSAPVRANSKGKDLWCHCSWRRLETCSTAPCMEQEACRRIWWERGLESWAGGWWALKTGWGVFLYPLCIWLYLMDLGWIACGDDTIRLCLNSLLCIVPIA